MQEALAADQWNDLSRLSQAYALGLIGWEQFEDARHVLVLRRRVVTGLAAWASAAACELIPDLTLQALERLQTDADAR